MIRAKYLGVDCQRVHKNECYEISTRCKGDYLVVLTEGKGFKYTFSYNSLEQFLKEWKVEAVYHR